MSATKQPVFLRLFKGDQVLEVKQFTGSQIVIGREGQIDFMVPDQGVSPIHAMIEEREPGRYFLCDLGGVSGTLVNGQKIVDVALESGMEFQIGDYKIDFHIGIPKPKRQAAPAAGVSTPPPAPADAGAPLKAKPTAPPPKAPPAPARPADVSHGDKTFVSPQVPVKPLTRGPSIPTTPAKGTFAPKTSSQFHTNVKPSQGAVLELIVSWKDRVLNTYHYDKRQVIHIGSHPKNDIILPLVGSIRMSHPLVEIGDKATVILTHDMTGELITEKGTSSLEDLKRSGMLRSLGNGFAYTLQQREMIRLNLGEGVQITIRYTGASAKPMVAPMIDVAVGQLPYLLLLLLGVGLFLFYVFLYAPPAPEIKEEETTPARKAEFIYKRQKVDLAEEDTKPQEQQSSSKVEIKTKNPVAPDNKDEGKAAEAKPNQNKTNKKVLTADKAGKDKGIQKPVANAKPDAGAKSQAKDVSKTGLLSAFGTKGLQDTLNKAFKGSGNVAGLSQSATGQGAEAAGAGNVAGNGLRETGAGGNGTATVGIAGVGTKGRGGGLQGYGTGSLGGKKNASIVAGDSDATFTGTIDKEAIRRVVQQNIRQIKACYEKGLNREPGLYGKIVIRWTIGGGGRVLDAGVKTTTMNSAEVENCAVARLKTWKFPEPPSGEVAEVSYPFVFQAQE